MSLAPLGDGAFPVVVHVLEVPGGQRRGDTKVGVTSITRSGQGSVSAEPPGGQGQGSRSSSTRTNSARTGSPIRTWSGRTPGSSPTIRTPSGSWTSAMTSGSFLPGTGGWWWTT